MTPLPELERLAREATPGPWQSRKAAHPVDGEYDYAIGAHLDGRMQVIAECFGRTDWHSQPPAGANAAYIAAMSPDQCLALIERVKKAEEAMRERAAQWHDQRAKDTPDAFEIEFHQISAAAIRALPTDRGNR